MGFRIQQLKALQLYRWTSSISQKATKQQVQSILRIAIVSINYQEIMKAALLNLQQQFIMLHDFDQTNPTYLIDIINQLGIVQQLKFFFERVLNSRVYLFQTMRAVSAIIRSLKNLFHQNKKYKFIDQHTIQNITRKLFDFVLLSCTVIKRHFHNLHIQTQAFQIITGFCSFDIFQFDMVGYYQNKENSFGQFQLQIASKIQSTGILNLLQRFDGRFQLAKNIRVINLLIFGMKPQQFIQLALPLCLQYFKREKTSFFLMKYEDKEVWDLLIKCIHLNKNQNEFIIQAFRQSKIHQDFFEAVQFLKKKIMQRKYFNFEPSQRNKRLDQQFLQQLFRPMMLIFQSNKFCSFIQNDGYRLIDILTKMIYLAKQIDESYWYIKIFQEELSMIKKQIQSYSYQYEDIEI